MSIDEQRPQASPSVWPIYEDGNWEDLRFPVHSINPAGQVAPPSLDTSDGTFLFSASAVNSIAGVAQMPHSWIPGTPIRPHIHWCPTNTDNKRVFWRFSYEIKNMGGVYSGFTDIDKLVNASGVAERHSITSFGILDMTGLEESSIIKWKIARIGNDGTDDYTGTVRLLEFDIHYRIGKIGSETEF